MGLAMCREYLTVIGAKDARHVPDKRPNRPARYRSGVRVSGGMARAHWRRLLKTIKQWGFDGPITVHTEYTEDQDVLFTVGGKDLSEEAGSRREVGAVEDLRFIRREWEEGLTTPAVNAAGISRRPARNTPLPSARRRARRRRDRRSGFARCRNARCRVRGRSNADGTGISLENKLASPTNCIPMISASRPRA